MTQVDNANRPVYLTEWAPVTADALRAIAVHQPIIELCAGDGIWARAMQEHGIDVIAFDKSPRGEGVRRGDEGVLAAHASRTLLMIWPPDGGRVAWSIVSAYPGKKVITIGADRFFFPKQTTDSRASGVSSCPPGFVAELTLRLPPGRKGGNMLRVCRREETRGVASEDKWAN